MVTVQFLLQTVLLQTSLYFIDGRFSVLQFACVCICIRKQKGKVKMYVNLIFFIAGEAFKRNNMNRVTFFILIQFITDITFAQQKNFEGIVVYKTEVKSKSANINDRLMKRMFALGDSNIEHIKNGNYRNTNDVCTEYYISSAKKVYLKFMGIDTLYYMNYSDDTSTVTGISREEGEREIAGFACRQITISTPDVVRKFFYSPLFFLDPKPDADNRIGRYDVFAKETSSLWLARYDEGKTYSLSSVCSRIQTGPVADTVFKLPDLPQKKFVYEVILKPAQYKGTAGWDRYLQTHLNADLGAKYIKIPKGEKMAQQIVMVSFIVNENGHISDVQVLNRNEVHTKLAEEAVRVISEAPAWSPATVFGERLKYNIKQPVTFAVIKD